MNVADTIAAILKSEGADYLFTYPTTPLIDACAKIGVRPLLCRQERVGVHMADAYARTLDGTKPAVFAMQYGPGAENAFPGVATAYSDSSPILVLPLGHPRDRAQVFPHFNIGKAFDGITKHYECLGQSQETGAVMRRALSRLKMGRLGPVMVEVPVDVMKEEIDPTIATSHIPATIATPGVSSADIDRAAKALLNARRPVIVAGQGVLYARASADLVALAEALAIPVMTTLEGKSAFPETHPLALGCGAIVMPGPVHQFLNRADLVLGVGTSFTRHQMNATIPGRKTLIQITTDERDLNKAYSTDYPILGDATLALQALLAAVTDLGVGQRDRHGVEREIADSYQAWLAGWLPKLTSDETPITPYRAIWDFMKAVDPDTAIVTHDSGSPRDQITPFYRAGGPRSYLGWGKSHALGSALGLSMGTKLAAPDKFCVSFQGDAAFGMCGLDFETAVRNEIAITAVVWNNNSMATEAHALPAAHEIYRVRDIRGTYAEMATAMGGHAERITDPREIIPAYERARRINAEGRPVLIEMMTSHEIAFSHRYGA
ncbi:MAG: thiamine pyrophosphate-requiring protein [Beijerinckiaceae bacterium]|nr:thiamine pyrophosphate-requiring protein [Beijerinckiaceae bacterium]